MSLVLALLIAASPTGAEKPAGRRPVVRIATASVTIIRAETIRLEPSSAPAGQFDRQYRQRDSVQITEFF
ncbi:MAG: hypothetical protein WBO17_06140 [Sphingorhabdus sp.]